LREIVAVCAILGGIIELIAAIGGPQLAGVGSLTNEPAPAMDTGPLLVGIAAAAVAIVGGARISLGHRSRPWGVLIVAATLLGVAIVGPLTGFFTIAALITVPAGLLALLIRDRRVGAR